MVSKGLQKRVFKGRKKGVQADATMMFKGVPKGRSIGGQKGV
jgi:hypothetical protein